MSGYKVSYFNITALGEPIRWLLSYGGLSFEDNRVERGDWPALKEKTPYGQMPLLEYNGKCSNQSNAICRYLAKQVKLVGKDDWEDMEIDAMVGNIDDLRMRMAMYHYEQDENLKKSKKEPLFKETIPFYLQRLDKSAKDNNGYLVGKKLTWADVYFVSLLDYFNGMTQTDLIADYPNLQTVKNNVISQSGIKKWIETRPKTEI